MPRIAVVGAGAVGLTLAGRLAQHGTEVTLYEAEPEHDRVGSRAICMQRETLEIWARLGVGERVASRGVRWQVGRTYHRGRLLFETHLPAGDEHFPPFVNISQSEVEELLEERIGELGVSVRRGMRFTDLRQDADGVDISFATEGGIVVERADHLVGADGAHSAVRHVLGTGFEGTTFDDRFLIADIRATLPFANERHFHFDPPWNPGRQVLIHPQPDGIWRIDWQVSPETDLEAEIGGAGLAARIGAVIGAATPHEVVWATGYRFSQRLAKAFRVGRVFLAGDAAHVMSPFGARGLNSGVADAENLAWKLAAGELLETYELERRAAARENLAATGATMRFMAPRGPFARASRALTLALAPRSRWFRARVNSGRLAEPPVYAPSAAIEPGPDEGPLRHGSVAPDTPMREGGRLRERFGRGDLIVAPRPLDSPPWDAEVAIVGTGTPYGASRAWRVRPDGYLRDSVAIG